MWFDQVVELLLHIFRMYTTMAWTVVLGLFQMLCRSLRVLMWRTASTGNSQRRKKSAGMGEELLSLRKPLSILF